MRRRHEERERERGAESVGRAHLDGRQPLLLLLATAQLLLLMVQSSKPILLLAADRH